MRVELPAVLPSNQEGFWGGRKLMSSIEGNSTEISWAIFQIFHQKATWIAVEDGELTKTQGVGDIGVSITSTPHNHPHRLNEESRGAH